MVAIIINTERIKKLISYSWFLWPVAGGDKYWRYVGVLDFMEYMKETVHLDMWCIYDDTVNLKFQELDQLE